MDRSTVCVFMKFIASYLRTSAMVPDPYGIELPILAETPFVLNFL